jgi:hypothetical protein
MDCTITLFDRPSPEKQPLRRIESDDAPVAHPMAGHEQQQENPNLRSFSRFGCAAASR